MKYKITFDMQAEIIYNDIIMFDGLLLYCWMRHKYGDVYDKNALKKEKDNNFLGMPLSHNKNNYLASAMFVEEKYIESKAFWQKQWCSTHDDKADFEKLKRKVAVSSGTYKSYLMPMQTIATKQVYFLFESDNIDQVKFLIIRYLTGIGKKTAQGYGFFNLFEIKEFNNFSFVNEILRPIQIENVDIDLLRNLKTIRTGISSHNLIYWQPPFDVCYIPNLRRSL